MVIKNYEFNTQNKIWIFKMRDLNQLIIKFDYEQNFKDDDFYVSSSNEHIFSLIDNWPKWEKNL